MLTTYTSSEEENIPYLLLFAQNITSNDEDPKLFEDTSDWHACSSLFKLWEHRPQAPDLVNSSPLPHPPNKSLVPLKKLFYNQCKKGFFFVVVVFHYNEGLENKLTRAPL